MYAKRKKRGAKLPRKRSLKEKLVMSRMRVRTPGLLANERTASKRRLKRRHSRRSLAQLPKK